MTPPVTPKQSLADILNEIESRAKAATPGPWDTMVIRGMGFCLGVESEGEGFVCEVNQVRSRYKANAIFIASARTDVPTLVEALRFAVTGFEYIRDCEPSLTVYGTQKLQQLAAILTSPENGEEG